MSRGVVQEPSIYGRIGSRSGGQCWQADNRVMARRAEGSQRHVAARYRPLIVLLHRARSDETNDGINLVAGHRLLTEAGYDAIGFDHFALPDDSIARAAREGRLRRNFQGFTDDPAEILLGLGASAISQFPDLIVQNEKQAGPWRECVERGSLPAARGTLCTADDRRRGRIIEAVLCRGEAHVDAITPMPDLMRFERSDLVRADGADVRLTPDALPYARCIAAAFDSYLQPAEMRFSHAV